MGYVEHLERAVGTADSVLDVGCGNNSPLGRFTRRPAHATGVDLYEPWLEESRSRGLHDEYVQANILEIADRFPAGSFDVVMACDVLEHLEHDDGARLLEAMEKVARRRVVVLTPNGWVQQGANYGNPYQVHRAGWTPAELRSRGFRVEGLSGFRVLRGERGIVRVRPRRIGEPIAMLTEPIVRNRPEWAFHLLAVKNR